MIKIARCDISTNTSLECVSADWNYESNSSELVEHAATRQLDYEMLVRAVCIIFSQDDEILAREQYFV